MTPVNVQLGCGFSVGEDWLNFDSSPRLRLERPPVLGGLAVPDVREQATLPRRGSLWRHHDRVAGSRRHREGVVCFSCARVCQLRELQVRAAKGPCPAGPGGLLIVPDPEERARRYVAALDAGRVKAGGACTRNCMLGAERRPKGPINFLRQMIGGGAHQWMWDHASMAAHLEAAGFVEVRRATWETRLTRRSGRSRTRPASSTRTVFANWRCRPASLHGPRCPAGRAAFRSVPARHHAGRPEWPCYRPPHCRAQRTCGSGIVRRRP
jgi:hypothetical protein